jgi:uncharacterized protein YndB with AHSA1/START domain
VVDPPYRFAFRWPIEGWVGDDPPLTLVTFTLEPVVDGTRLRLVESGFAQASDDVARSAHEANSQGWTVELGDLENYLDAVV